MKMSIILSTKDKDQLLPEGYRYRRERLTWCCVKDNCKDRARYKEQRMRCTKVMYVKHQIQKKLRKLYVAMKLEEKLKTRMINRD